MVAVNNNMRASTFFLHTPVLETSMTNKGAILYTTDLLAAVLLGGLVLTGILLQWVLPHGGGPGGGGHRGVRARDAEFLSLARHEWGDVHFWISVAFVAAIAVHLLMHLGWIKAATLRYLRLTPRKPQAQPTMAA
jgi:hypothetical protein